MKQTHKITTEKSAENDKKKLWSHDDEALYYTLGWPRYLTTYRYLQFVKLHYVTAGCEVR